MKLIECKNKNEVIDSFLIRRKVFIEEQNVSYDIEFDLLEKDAIMFLYQDDNNNNVCTCRLFIENDNDVTYGHLGRVATLKEYRGLGYASKMLECIEKYLLDKGIHEIRIHAQLSASSFYLKNDYVKCSDIFMEANIEHIMMKKTF